MENEICEEIHTAGKEVNAVVGENIVPVEVTTYINSDGHYVVMLGNETIKYTPFKMALRR